MVGQKKERVGESMSLEKKFTVKLLCEDRLLTEHLNLSWDDVRRIEDFITDLRR